ncbi:metal-sensitive transcriptional regulator [Pseudidiomarina terrestris]|uniref:Metal-sensitive transcriptional regulator n=1 Tax=Pseudidiomarina terrestris TaxID=2820060 RepID=A0AAW7QWX8_9GAMM|nr:MULTISPECIES: metal-sensitive transcriptional regulator [unclassified Pseudidiomarina]MDN7124672.1 metal-sensitive transcriptional regulator [Pseudidiomarina sp. 1APP75-32.1]MDN7126780.1 metal-sensitive transcriptional regulator [Pseudidiomarina sp. 1APR75-33.1]MDN7129037.1 metal-sensitive transcriptional regulator [Pseudidiomarina sp. 1APR75-15]MDN7134700.1 metal-sensitive transcriptional regulator [Pseudidiomarina sp. 1ASP75-5]MDN7136631.1 metal-sensitive transcriptional regulator [Pseudi
MKTTATPHPDALKTNLAQRLKRIEGQVRGLQKLIENDTYCDDVLMQLASVQSALNGVAKKLLSQHMQTCVKARLNAGDDSVLTELDTTIERLLKR